jgi:nitroreductase
MPNNELATLAAELMRSRQTILPKRLMEPGPDANALNLILGAAASAPDHGQILPWRFVLVPVDARSRLADVFGAALLERDADATPDQVAQAQEKAHRAPLLMLVVVDGQRVRRAKHVADGHRVGLWLCADQRQGPEVCPAAHPVQFD